MINMMYLVLTALLALNVSKETLDVIAKVGESLEQTNENLKLPINRVLPLRKTYSVVNLFALIGKFSADAYAVL